MKKFVKISLITVGAVLLVLGLGLSIFVGVSLTKYSHLELDEDLLASPTANVLILDKENRPIEEENTETVKFASLNQLPPYVAQAFISVEDKDFYHHNGLNYKRIAKAVISNLKSHSLKEGASTISQQLIKNTHLSSEKTFERKLKEIALTKKLEKSHSKDEILEFFNKPFCGYSDATREYYSFKAWAERFK